MRKSPCFLIMLIAMTTFASHAETTTECLNRLKTQKMQIAKRVCWQNAEGEGGVIPDNSPEVQQALACEDRATQLNSMEENQCADLANPVGAVEVQPLPPVGGGDDLVPLPPNRPPIAGPKVKGGGGTTTPPKTTPKTANAKPAAKKAAPQTSGSGTTPESLDAAQAHADQDMAACSSARSQAVQCCSNPMSCSGSMSINDQMSLQSLNQQTQNGPKQGQSISDYCSQMQQASASSGNVNNALAGVCYSNQSTCSSTCSSLVDKYQALVSNCGDCEASGVYQAALGSLTSSSTACTQLRANASQMAQQGVGSSNGQTMGSLCSNQSNLNPMGMGGGPDSSNFQAAGTNPNDPYGCQTNPSSPACQSCATNPTGEACKAQQNAQALAQGKAGFQTGSAKKTDGSGFNPASIDDASATNKKMNLASADAPGLAAQNKAATVPNNSGGAIPGEGGATPPANLAAGNGKGGAQPAAGASTDIMQGTHSGGGYSQGSGFESMSGSPFRALASAAGKVGGYAGMDLKKYLPGQNPQQIAGLNGRNAEINGQSADLFKKISSKIEEKCKLGILWECKP